METCSSHWQMLHDTGKSIAVSIGFVSEKLEVGKNSALEKLDLLFFFFFFFSNEVGDLCMCVCVCVCVCVVCWCG